MTAQSKPAKTDDTTSGSVPTAHAEFLAALEQAIQATRRVQHAPPLAPSAHPADRSDLPPRSEPRAASSNVAPPQTIDRSSRPRLLGERRPLDRVSGATRPVSAEQQRQREAVIEQLRQRHAKPDDLKQSEPRHWLGIAVLTRLAIVGVIAFAVAFAAYALVSVGPQWSRLFANANDPAQTAEDRPSMLTDLSGAVSPTTPPDQTMPKPVKTTTITADAHASTAWAGQQMATSNPAPASSGEPAVNAPPAANAGPSESAEPAVENVAAVTARHLDADEITKLLKRSELFLNNGDIAAAQLLLRRAAEAGDARAALALAATYDPLVLKQLRVVGAKNDIVEARVWYRRAARLGSAEAASRLQQLAGEAR